MRLADKSICFKISKSYVSVVQAFPNGRPTSDLVLTLVSTFTDLLPFSLACTKCHEPVVCWMNREWRKMRLSRFYKIQKSDAAKELTCKLMKCEVLGDTVNNCKTEKKEEVISRRQRSKWYKICLTCELCYSFGAMLGFLRYGGLAS